MYITIYCFYVQDEMFQLITILFYFYTLYGYVFTFLRPILARYQFIRSFWFIFVIPLVLFSMVQFLK
jgi:hypothetical protein